MFMIINKGSKILREASDDHEIASKVPKNSCLSSDDAATVR